MFQLTDDERLSTHEYSLSIKKVLERGFFMSSCHASFVSHPSCYDADSSSILGKFLMILDALIYCTS